MQQRMTFVDNWNTIEQVCLASAVRAFGEVNWSAVCKFLRTRLSLIERPSNWLTPESCEAQYKWLSDKYVRMEISCERPVNQILQNLKQIGKQESQSLLEQEKKYNQSKERIESFAKDEIDFDTAMKYYEEAFKRFKEREENLRKQGIKSDSPNTLKSAVKQDNKTDGSSPLTTSPLLSSLLNNPPAVQYRPTLSTTSFLPTKTAQGTTRTSYDRVHTSEISQRNAYSSNLGSQSTPLNERSSLFSNSTSPVRKLDFQDPSTSSLNAATEQLLPTKNSNEDITCDEATIDSNIPNLDNISLLPAPEEFLSDADIIPQEVLMQVIGNLEGKQLIDKVLDKLTCESDTVIEKDLGTVTIPLHDSFVTGDSTVQESVPILNASFESKSNIVLDSSVINTEFERTGHEYEAAQDVVIIEEPQINKQITQNTDIAAINQSALLETVAKSVDTSVFPSIEISDTTESVSKLRRNSETLIECLEASEAQKDDKSWQTVENIEINEGADLKSSIKTETDRSIVNESLSNVSDETRESESAEGYETCESTPDTSVTCDTLIPNEPNSNLVDKKLGVEISDICEADVKMRATDKITEEKKDEVRLETKTTESIDDLSSTNTVENQSDINKVSSKEFNENEKEKLEVPKAKDTGNDTNMRVEWKPEDNSKVEETPQRISTRTSKSVCEVRETVESNVSSLATINEKEELKSSKSEEKLVDLKASSPTQINDNHEDVKCTAVKNRRLPLRRRRSTVSEPNEIAKVAKNTEEVENVKKEETDAKNIVGAKEMNVTIKDFQTEGLDSDISEGLLKIKEELMDEVTQSTQATPTRAKVDKEKPVGKSVDTKSAKQKTNISRRSSIRTQNLNTSTKVEEITPSPTTSKTTDSIAQSTKKKSLILAHQRLAMQKYSSAFLKPISNKNVAGYEDVIYSPLDLQAIKRKIDKGHISTVTEFQRDVLLMILNAKMFNPTSSQVYNMAVEIQKEALRDIQLTVQTLGEGVLLEMDEITEKARKRQSVENMKKEQKPIKRGKPTAKDEGSAAKKIKLEETDTS